jgi:hypothetical protein
MKKITICGSMSFIKEIQQIEQELIKSGITVYTPQEEGTAIDYDSLEKEERTSLKQKYIDDHIEKIKDSKAILIANYRKKDAENYIGANTFLEMAFAYILKKKIFILNKIPAQPNTLEIEALKPVELKGDLNNLLDFLNKV